MIDYENHRPEPLRRLTHKAAAMIPISWIRPRALVGIDRGVFLAEPRAHHLLCFDVRPPDRHVDDHWRAYRPTA